MMKPMDVKTELEKLLEPGETVIWAAQPEPWPYARPTFMLYIVAVPWTVFTFFWLRAVTGGFHWPGKTAPPIPWWMPWVAISAGVILLILGLWMLSAPYWIWREGKRTIHALTNRRALVVNMGRPKKLQALTLEGKVNFRITDPDAAISDLDVICGTAKGLLFRAVKNPKSALSQAAQTI
ncbi:MAG: hypothetical protein ABIT76_10490 [Chthoniobacterales bacterium]